jgi:hypothetical protein
MRTTVLLAAAMLAMAALANASLIATLSTETPIGSNFAFNYSATVTADERLDPAATSGVTCPGPGSTLIQCDPEGTFFTIYDIPGFVSASVSTPGWAVSEQALGITPSTINGLAFDSLSLMNVTFMYTGPIVSGPMSFTGFQIVSSDAGINLDGHFTSQSTNNVAGSGDNGTTEQLAGSVAVPLASVPEPGSLTMMGLGVVGILLGGARRRRT